MYLRIVLKYIITMYIYSNILFFIRFIPYQTKSQINQFPQSLHKQTITIDYSICNRWDKQKKN